MKEKIKKYVDNLFSEIYETKQLNELKEEISANLLEKINDFISNGDSEDLAFEKAVANLGDMGELIESLKKASSEKVKEDMFMNPTLDKKHVIGYVIASAILLFGAMTAGIVYLQQKNIMQTIASLMPFALISIPIFIFFGLTQETAHEYGMSKKRALGYTAASELFIFGAFITGIVYFNGNKLFEVLATFMPFGILSIAAFIYLGLTEKSRSKMDSNWQKQWVQYYSNPELMILRGNISGALWIFSFAVFLLIGFSIGWKYSWITFVFATGCEVLIEAIFTARNKSS